MHVPAMRRRRGTMVRYYNVSFKQTTAPYLSPMSWGFTHHDTCANQRWAYNMSGTSWFYPRVQMTVSGIQSAGVFSPHRPSFLFRPCHNPPRRYRTTKLAMKHRITKRANAQQNSKTNGYREARTRTLKQAVYIQVTPTMHRSNRGRVQTVEPGSGRKDAWPQWTKVSRSGNTWKHPLIPT